MIFRTLLFLDFVYIPGRGVCLEYVPDRGSRFMYWRSGKMCSAPAKYVSIDSIELGMFGLSNNCSTLLRPSEIFLTISNKKRIAWFFTTLVLVGDFSRYGLTASTKFGCFSKIIFDVAWPRRDKLRPCWTSLTMIRFSFDMSYSKVNVIISRLAEVLTLSFDRIDKNLACFDRLSQIWLFFLFPLELCLDIFLVSWKIIEKYLVTHTTVGTLNFPVLSQKVFFEVARF